MKIRIVFILFTGLLVAQPNSDLDQIILDHMNSGYIPGLSACIVVNDQVIWSNSYGTANITLNIPVTEDTHFLLASISKLVTTTAIMQLYENGSIDLHDSINQYLPLELAIAEAIEVRSGDVPITVKSHPGPQAKSKNEVKSVDSSNSVKTADKPAESPARKSTELERKNVPLKPRAAEITNVPVSNSENKIDEKWNELLRELRQVGNRFNIAALLRGSYERKIVGNSLTFIFQHSSHAERLQGEIEDPLVRNQIMDATLKILGTRYDIDITQPENGTSASGRPASQRSHLVRAAQSLGATIIEERNKQT